MLTSETDADGQAMLPKNGLNFKEYRHKFSAPLAMSTNLHKKKFQAWKKTREKSFLGRCWAKIGLRNTQPNV